MASSLKVIFDDLSKHPSCSHGPTLMFSKSNENGKDPELFFACSAHRNKEACDFFIKKSDYDKKGDKEIVFNNSLLPNPEATRNIKEKIAALSPRKQCYCYTCNVLYKVKRRKMHEKHKIKVGFTNEELQTPTKFLPPLNDDKAEAQYFFADKTLHFFGDTFMKLGVRKVICIGAPRLHEYLNSNFRKLEIKSILLDFDYRFIYFFNQDEFCWYNMFNHHFFEKDLSKKTFDSFLKCDKDETILLFTDPPFGCRTEPLVQTIKEISSSYKRLNNFTNILPIFWIFPYFMERYITNCMPEMEMSDYKINYTNHQLYSDGDKGRKYGSPVRFFTNIPLNLIELPTNEGYKFCTQCKRWTMDENRHCNFCKECPSKNGESYRHCDLCSKCVKPNYKHCTKCRRCTQKIGHSCVAYQGNITCWICKKKGHAEHNCLKWIEIVKNDKRYKNIIKKISKNLEIKGKRTCLICTKIGHNESRCRKREILLKEKTFMGVLTNMLE